MSRRIIISSKALDHLIFNGSGEDCTLLYEDKVLSLGSQSTTCHGEGPPFQMDVSVGQFGRMIHILKTLEEQPIVMEFGEGITLHDIRI